ncbi:ISAs1 family transposase [Candidatus Rhabdochlamydia oedothoracis]|uniref:ISAs1 family transposase n=1 Tax=Candidatus Rhabdochlamydia oedothoracis TaxID=2720720 RepID=UPI0024792E9D|nr:ISAs1 family transposase [Candidatus Rhabdochlamydia oedothoracis]
MKALPKLMDLLDLKSSIITADALNTQKAIAKKTINMGADYVLPVKRNHPNLFEEIKALFENAETKNYSDFDSDAYETMEKSHGRIELRKYYSLDATKLPSAKEWEGLLSVGMVIRTRTEREGKNKQRNGILCFKL